MVSGQTTGPDGVTVSFGDHEQLTADTVVVAIGRRPLSESARTRKRPRLPSTTAGSLSS
ncbi:MAG: FAD-dependent oxidoreductase [Acidimicrobiales bacterium]